MLVYYMRMYESHILDTMSAAELIANQYIGEEDLRAIGMENLLAEDARPKPDSAPQPSGSGTNPLARYESDQTDTSDSGN